MTDSDPGNNRYQLELDAAVEMFDNGDMDKCLAAAKKNLTDFSLPPFYFIKNCILIACALDDWEDADIYRRGAEQRYTKALAVTDKDDKDALEVLQDLREELDELKGFRDADLGALFREDTMDWDVEEGEEEEEEEEKEEEEEEEEEVEEEEEEEEEKNWSENEEGVADTENEPEKEAET